MNHIEEEYRVQPEEWNIELVKDLTREVFDVYFLMKYPPEVWKKVLQSGKRCRGVQKNEPVKQDGKPLLNKSELGRLCYILKLSPSNFNNIFGTQINASNAPSSQKVFCKQSENDERTNIYRLCKEIFYRHCEPMPVPGMSEEDLMKEMQQYNNESDDRIAEMKALIEDEEKRKREIQRRYSLLIDFMREKSKEKATK